MGTIAGFVALLLSFSVAAERVVAIIKKWIPQLNTPTADEDWEARRQSILQVFSALVGTGIAWLCRDQVTAVVPSAKQMGISIYPLMGLLASGGSGFWSDLLSVLQAIKTTRRARAEADAREMERDCHGTTPLPLIPRKAA